MNLPKELFEQITQTINIVGRDEPRADDRRAPRVKLSSHLSVSTWANPSSPFNLRVRDMSVGGMGIFHSDRIGLDEQLVIRVPLKNDQSVLIMSNVIYWEPLAENLFGIGVQFERLVEECELTEQIERSTRRQSQDIGMMSRLTQAFARTWRIAS